MEQAIKKAIEGGWKPNTWGFETIIFDGLSTDKQSAMFSNKKGDDACWFEYPVERFVLDPTFWQCLGKIEGWGTKMISIEGVRQRNTWDKYFHFFIDHLIEGKDVNSFFEQLLK